MIGRLPELHTFANAQPATARARRCRAFTLVEVLMVVLVMGIAAAVVVPQMMQAGTLTIQGATRMVVADLLLAQNDAIAMQATRKIIFDVANDTYRVTDGDGQTITATWEGTGANNYVRRFGQDERFRGVRLVSVTFPDQEVEFDDLGGPLAGGTIDLQSNDTRYRITVAALTGRVTIDPVSMTTP